LSLFQREKLSKIGNKIKDEFYMKKKKEFDEKRNNPKAE